MASELTVSQLNFYIKSVFESEPRLRRVLVKGEISNFTEHYKSGHLYFSLKDSASAIKVVMFRSSAAKLRFSPENGMSVIVGGRVSVYERDGQYQLYADSIVPDGEGALAAAYEQLKKKLLGEGLFDPDRKKPLPEFPSKIGVVTAKDGAAVRDIITILGRRWPMAEIILCPVLVQGALAAASVSNAVKKMNELKCCDVIIVGRGGGSIEDLWAFNEELTVRSIAESEIPIISAVGHETDFTLCDFAADLRAPTPSAAAELCVPDKSEIVDRLMYTISVLRSCAENRLAFAKAETERLSDRIGAESLCSYIDGEIQFCDGLVSRLRLSAEKKLTDSKTCLAADISALEAMSPLKVLSRGYAVCEKDSNVIESIKQLKTGDRAELIFADGRALCDIAEVKAGKI